VIGRILGNLGLAGAAVLLTLLLGEVVSRFLFPEWVPEAAERSFWEYDEALGWVNQSGRTGVHRHSDFAVDVSISDQGLRDRSYPEARTPGTRRMLVLGDSFAWGYGVEQAEIWHEVLEARHPGWEIINAGVAGYGTDQQLLYLERRGLEFEPDVVLLLLHPNDFLDNNEPFRYGYFKPHYELDGDSLRLTQVPVPQLDWEARFDRYLRFHTYLLYRVYHAPEIYEAWQEARGEAREPPPVSAKPRAPEKAVKTATPEPAEATSPTPPKERQRAAQSDEEDAERQRKRRERRQRAAASRPARKSKYDVDLALTERLLRELRDQASANAAKFLVVSVPMPDPPRSRFARSVEDAGIPLLLLDAALRNPAEPIRYANDPHWTPHGHALAADAIEGFLREQAVLEPAP
jgi:hypothetical protein